MFEALKQAQPPEEAIKASGRLRAAVDRAIDRYNETHSSASITQEPPIQRRLRSENKDGQCTQIDIEKRGHRHRSILDIILKMPQEPDVLINTSVHHGQKDHIINVNYGIFPSGRITCTAFNQVLCPIEYSGSQENQRRFRGVVDYSEVYAVDKDCTPEEVRDLEALIERAEYGT